MRSQVRLLIAAAIAAPCMATAQRPLVTDDADMLEAGKCHVESYWKRQRRIDQAEAWLLPACNPWGGIELTLGGYRVAPSPEGPARGVFLQGKVLLERASASRWGSAVSFGAEGVRASAESSIGRKQGWKPFVNLLVSGPVAGDALTLRGNLGYARDTLEKDDLLLWAAAAEFPLGGRARGFVETYQVTGVKPTQHLGMLFWLMPERLWIDASVGFRGIAREQNPSERGRFVTIGLKYHFALDGR